MLRLIGVSEEQIVVVLSSFVQKNFFGVYGSSLDGDRRTPQKAFVMGSLNSLATLINVSRYYPFGLKILKPPPLSINIFLI